MIEGCAFNWYSPMLQPAVDSYQVSLISQIEGETVSYANFPQENPNSYASIPAQVDLLKVTSIHALNALGVGVSTSVGLVTGMKYATLAAIHTAQGSTEKTAISLAVAAGFLYGALSLQRKAIEEFQKKSSKRRH